MITLLFALSARANDGLAAPTEAQVYSGVRPDDAPPRPFEAFALVQTRVQVNNLESTNPFLDGQVIGRLGGTNGVVVREDGPRSLTAEQRVGTFFSWKPAAANRRAELGAAFEVDFGWGDQSYNTGGNTGGGFGGDQVNLQTRRLYVALDGQPAPGHLIRTVVGLQFVGDSAQDPTRSTPDGLLRSGARLAFFGSEAAGISVYGRHAGGFDDLVRWRLGAYTLAELATAEPDDVALLMADVEVRPAYRTTVGGHAWFLQDRSGGAGGALGLGPTSALSELQGGPRLDPYDGLPRPPEALIDADLGWVGVDGGYNADLLGGPLGVHGVALAQLGRLYAPVVHDDRVRGAWLDAEARLRWMRGSGSVFRLEGFASTGRSDPDQYGGVVTGNSYGVAGALFNTHGTLILFPDPRAINRLTPVVADVSGGLRGLAGATSTLAADVVPERLTVALHGGWAADGGGEAWGTEVGGRVVGEPLPFLEVGLYAATCSPGPASGLASRVQVVYAQLDWLVF